jgi:AcrR family transcriptional regulator
MTHTNAADTTTASEVDPRTERTRRAIEQAARDLLDDGGPDAVTHVNVASTANVSRTTVYKHHPTRSSLIRASLEFQDPFPDEFTGDLRADLMAMVGHLVDDLADEEKAHRFATFLERSCSDPELEDAADEIVSRGRVMLTELLEHGVRTGQIREGIDPSYVMSGLIGTFLFRALLSNEPVNREVAADVIDHFLTHHSPT